MARAKSTRFPDELLEEKFNNLHTVVHERYRATDEKLEENKNAILTELGAIKEQTTATNGKVRKIIIALVLAFGLIVGMGFEQLGPVLAVILAA
jgi:hypothetical protein